MDGKLNSSSHHSTLSVRDATKPSSNRVAATKYACDSYSYSEAWGEES